MKLIALRVVIGWLVGFFACYSRVFAADDGPYFYRAGVHLSRDHRITNQQLKVLIDGLRFWTGLSELTFDPHGTLNPGNRSEVTGGSQTARELIIAAIE